jgi:hypothetical protein
MRQEVRSKLRGCVQVRGAAENREVMNADPPPVVRRTLTLLLPYRRDHLFVSESATEQQMANQRIRRPGMQPSI